MQRLSLIQTQRHKLSPKQIQVIKLLNLSSMAFTEKVKDEVDMNPALELEEDEVTKNEDQQKLVIHTDADHYSESHRKPSSKNSQDIGTYTTPIVSRQSLSDMLGEQLSYLRIDERQKHIYEHLIGSVETDGYIRRDPGSLASDLRFSSNISVSVREIREALRVIQGFEPPGIAATSLQECLLIQLRRKPLKDGKTTVAILILERHYGSLAKRQYRKILSQLSQEDAEYFEDALNVITKLNPKPGQTGEDSKGAQYLNPDFVLEITEGGSFHLSIHSMNSPRLKVNREYVDMVEGYGTKRSESKSEREARSFLKDKIDSARWFIGAIQQRRNTLVAATEAIITHQRAFLFSGEEAKLKPLKLKEIAVEIGKDTSTVSRVVAGKCIQTPLGIFPLKYFFTEAIHTTEGEDVSNLNVKMSVKEIVDKEDKTDPLSDSGIKEELDKLGVDLARRTITKYREQLHIPTARLRRHDRMLPQKSR